MLSETLGFIIINLWAVVCIYWAFTMSKFREYQDDGQSNRHEILKLLRKCYVLLSFLILFQLSFILKLYSLIQSGEEDSAFKLTYLNIINILFILGTILGAIPRTKKTYVRLIKLQVKPKS